MVIKIVLLVKTMYDVQLVIKVQSNKGVITDK
jgi:hypothetical protein